MSGGGEEEADDGANGAGGEGQPVKAVVDESVVDDSGPAELVEHVEDGLPGSPEVVAVNADIAERVLRRENRNRKEILLKVRKRVKE